MRTIKMDMNWKAAAQIMAAALENGTGKGRDMARAELFRMAGLLDAEQAQPASVHEVIADRGGPAYGVA